MPAAAHPPQSNAASSAVDAFDRDDFNPVQYINKMFPTGALPYGACQPSSTITQRTRWWAWTRSSPV